MAGGVGKSGPRARVDGASSSADVTQPVPDTAADPTAETTQPQASGSTYLSDEERQRVAKACAGDQRALRELFFAYQGQVRGHLYRLLGGDSEIDDLVQTVFARAFAALPEFRGNSALSTWLYRITANTTHNLLRQRFRRERLRLALRRFNMGRGADVQSESSVEVRDEVARLLSGLDPDLRHVFVLYHYEGLTLQEISSIVGRPISTIGDRLTRARKKLRTLASDR